MGKCLQIVFGFVNFIFWLLGVGLLALSIWLLVNPETFFEFAGDANEAINGNNATLPSQLTEFVSKIDSSLYLALAAGVLIFLLAFLGCCGAFRKNSCMLNMYAVIMVLLILVQIAVTALIFVSSSEVDEVFSDVVNKYNPTSTNEDDIAITQFVDQLQNSVDCCGWTGPSDFNNNTSLDGNLPESCCPNDTACTETDLIGCKETLKDYGLALGGIAAGCIILELLATIAACCIKKKDDGFA